MAAHLRTRATAATPQRSKSDDTKPPDVRKPLPLHAEARLSARVALAIALVAAALWTASDFLPALIWAAIMAIAVWPLYARVAGTASAEPSVLAALLFTVLIGLTACRLRSVTVAAEPHRDDMRADFFVFGALLAASAVASFAYAKDVVMSTAGVCYALVAFWAVRDHLIRVRRVGAAAAMAAVLLVASSLWAVRVVGMHHALRTQAFAFHNDWALMRYNLPQDPAGHSLVSALRDDALSRPVINPWFIPRWADRVFDIDF